MALPLNQPRRNLDRPAVRDRLGFDIYYKQIAATIREAAETNQLPLTIGVYGRWGSGKTSLMKMVEDELLRPGLKIAGVSNARQEKPSRAFRLVVAFLIFWGLFILLLGFFAPIGANALGGFLGISEMAYLTALFAIIFGMAGALTRVAYLMTYQRALRTYDPVYNSFYVRTLFLGIVHGLLIFLFIALLGGQLKAVEMPGWMSITIYVLTGLSTVTGIFDYLWRVYQARRERHTQDSGSTVAQPQDFPQFQVIWFNAWKYAKEDELWAALLQHILKELHINAPNPVTRLRIRWQLWKRSIEWKSGMQDVAKKLWPTVSRTILIAGAVALASWLANFAVANTFGAGEEVGQFAGTAAGFITTLATLGNWLKTNVREPLADIDFENYRKKTSYKDHLTFLSEFASEFKSIAKIARGEGNPIVLMLDDLDRCLPEQAVSVLEAIKLFIADDAPVVFVIGADREFIERAVEVKYEKVIAAAGGSERFKRMGREYLEKIVQLPFNLPPIERSKIDDFIDETFPQDTYVLDHSEIFADGLLTNPRQVLRAIGIYRFLLGIANEQRKLYTREILPDVLAVVVIVQYRWPELFNELIEHPTLLASIQQSYQPNSPAPPGDLSALLQTYAPNRDLRRLLTSSYVPSLEGINLRQYLNLSVTTQTEDTTQAKDKKAAPPEDEPAETAQVALGALNARLEKILLAIDELNTRDTDSALLSRLFETRSEIQHAMDTHSYQTALTLMSNAETLIKEARKELNAQEKFKQEPAIKARVSKSGHLRFERAIRYEPVQVQIKPTGEIITSFPGSGRLMRGAVEKDDELSSLLTEIKSLEVTTPELISTLGKKLGNSLNLTPLAMSQESKAFRFEFGYIEDSPLKTATKSMFDIPQKFDIPWELAWIDSERSQALSIDSRHSVVRVVTSPTKTPTFRSFRPPLHILLAISGDRSDEYFDLQIKFMNDILRTLPEDAYQLKTISHASAQELAEQRNFNPHIIHLNSPVFTETGSGLGLVLRNDRGEHQFVPLELLLAKETLPVADFIIFDGYKSYHLAREYVRNGIPASLGFQFRLSSEAHRVFTTTFYSALISSGQADFAITEGRRAIAAKTGADLLEPYAPVLFMNPATDGIIFR